MFELSCAEYAFPLLGRREALALLRLLDFDFVDIGLFERSANYLPSELARSPRLFVESVRADLDDAGLRPADVFLQIGAHPAEASANDPSKHVRLSTRVPFQKAVELCSAIGCTHLTGLPGVCHGEETDDFALALEEAAWRVETAAAAGIAYAIEPHIGSVCVDTITTHAFLSQAPGLTLTLDYGHFIAQGESNDAIHSLLPYASHLHLRGAALGRLQTPAAESAIDLQRILQTLSGAYHGRLALEYVWSDWHGCNRTDNLSETILLRRQIAALQNIPQVLSLATGSSSGLQPAVPRPKKKAALAAGIA